jgi:hypothetical protein
MYVTIRNITFDCADAKSQAMFWAAATGWAAHEHDATPGHVEYSVDPPEGFPRLYFTTVPEPKTVKNRVHLDVMPTDRTQDEEIVRLTGLGATVVSDRRPEFGWVILADPEGNEFCVEISAAELEAAQVAKAAT